MRRQRRFQLVIERKNIRQHEVFGARLDLPQIRAHQHRRQPRPELHGRAEHDHGHATFIELRNRLPEIRDHAVEPRRAGIFQPVRGHDHEVGLAVPKKRIHLFGEAAAGRIALRRRVERRHAGRLRRLQDIHALRTGRLAQAMEIMRSEAVTPQQPVGLAGCKREAGIAEHAARGRKAISGAIERLIIVGIVGFQLQRDTVGIRWRPAAMSRRRCPRAERRSRALRSRTQRAVSAPAICAERLFDKPPRQIRNHHRQREQRDLVGSIKHQAGLGERAKVNSGQCHRYSE